VKGVPLPSASALFALVLLVASWKTSSSSSSSSTSWPLAHPLLLRREELVEEKALREPIKNQIFTGLLNPI